MGRKMRVVTDMDAVKLLQQLAMDAVMDYISTVDSTLYSHYSVCIPKDDEYYCITFYADNNNRKTSEYVCYSPGMLDDTWVAEPVEYYFTLTRKRYFGLFTTKKRCEETRYRYIRTKTPVVQATLRKRFKSEDTYKTDKGYYISFGEPYDHL